jgi:hypothetical protein
MSEETLVLPMAMDAPICKCISEWSLLSTHEVWRLIQKSKSVDLTLRAIEFSIEQNLDAMAVLGLLMQNKEITCRSEA